MINLLNSTPASTVNNETVVVNAMNNATVVGQKFFTRTLPNVVNTQLLNHTNLIARVQEQSGQQLQQQQQTQTITLTSVNSGNFTNFTASKRLVAASSGESGASSSQPTLSALLVGTAAANRPEIIAASNSNPLLLEKLSAGPTNTYSKNLNASNSGNATNAARHQIMLQQSSPPPSTVANVSNASTTTVNVQGLNLAQLQSLQGLQVLTQPFSVLNVSSTGNLQGHSNLIVTLPVTTASTQTSNAVVVSSQTQVGGGATGSGTVASSVAQAGANNIGVTPQTVVLTNTGTSNFGKCNTFSLLVFVPNI